MKFLFFIGPLFLINDSFAQLTTHITWTEQTSMPASEVLYYNASRNLTWTNFTAKPPEDNSIAATMTVSGFGYHANVKTINEKGELNVSIYCYFNKSKSWVKPGRIQDISSIMSNTILTLVISLQQSLLINWKTPDLQSAIIKCCFLLFIRNAARS